MFSVKSPILQEYGPHLYPLRINPVTHPILPLLFLSFILFTGCSKEETEVTPTLDTHTITYTACGDKTFNLIYFDGDEKNIEVTGCFNISVTLSQGETAYLSCFSGENDPFVMAILQDDTTRCHRQCGPGETINLEWKIGKANR